MRALRHFAFRRELLGKPLLGADADAVILVHGAGALNGALAEHVGEIVLVPFIGEFHARIGLFALLRGGCRRRTLVALGVADKGFNDHMLAGADLELAQALALMGVVALLLIGVADIEIDFLGDVHIRLHAPERAPMVGVDVKRGEALLVVLVAGFEVALERFAGKVREIGVGFDTIGLGLSVAHAR